MFLFTAIFMKKQEIMKEKLYFENDLTCSYYYKFRVDNRLTNLL